MSETYTPAGTVGTSLKRATAAERATGTHGEEFMGANPTTIADKIRYLKDTGLVNFPATQVADANPNVLDDYEEGTWTPGLAFGGSSTGITYSASNAGTYRKIGSLVIARCHVELTNKGAQVGAATVTGLPFASGANISGGIGYYAAMAGITTPLFYVGGGATSANLTNAGAATSANLTEANFTNTTDLYLTIVYHV